ncbi:MAG: hypothetical protein LBG09_03060, partial [Puniceicoccales bacterium]|nr:hypothetical protein [Puniceicoccales bacterium]
MEMKKKYKLISLSLLCLWGLDAGELYALGAQTNRFEGDPMQKLRSVQESNLIYQQTVKRNQEEIGKLGEEVRVARAAIGGFQSMNDTLQKENKVYKAKIDKLQKENRELREEVERLQARAAQSQAGQAMPMTGAQYA